MKLGFFIVLVMFYGWVVWAIGYQSASERLSGNWYEGQEGYCLADKTPHPGECHDTLP